MRRHDADWSEGKVPAEWANPEVHKMRCLGRIGGQVSHFEADLVFISKIPYAVFEWDDYEGGLTVPCEVVQLDPNRLHPLPASWEPVRWMYELPIEDPRKLN